MKFQKHTLIPFIRKRDVGDHIQTHTMKRRICCCLCGRDLKHDLLHSSKATQYAVSVVKQSAHNTF